jgi:hypothetical protein
MQLTARTDLCGEQLRAVDCNLEDVCEAAAKSHEQAVRRLHWHSFEIVWTCSPTTSGLQPHHE